MVLMSYWRDGEYARFYVGPSPFWRQWYMFLRESNPDTGNRYRRNFYRIH